jgi:Predicted hydrolases or acyltransferases (alpha/beta hydrolase superfamily)
MRSELPVKSNGLHFWTESFGTHLPAPILLIAGAGAQSIFWEDEFCQRLAESERFVLRFDNRDPGLSDSVDFDSSPYTINDLAADAIALLDAYDLAAAHMVGASGGGLICQVLALEHRRRK